jgi:hypothetical protein
MHCDCIICVDLFWEGTEDYIDTYEYEMLEDNEGGKNIWIPEVDFRDRGHLAPIRLH